MTLGQLAFATLIWGSLASVVTVFGYLLWVVFRESGVAGDSTGRTSEPRP